MEINSKSSVSDATEALQTERQNSVKASGIPSSKSLNSDSLKAECNADLDHPCDSNDGDPCHECAANEAYWRREWERYGKYEMRGKAMQEQYEADVRDAYSSPADSHKLRSLLKEVSK